MKATLTCIACILANSLFSQSNIQQSLSVNGTGNAPDPSAQLDVSATDKGMLVPRMTTAQRTAIVSPAIGLLVFDNTTNDFWFYTGASWKNLSTQKLLADADNDTKVQVEEITDEDVIRFDVGGTEGMALRKNTSGAARLELSGTMLNTFIGITAGSTNSTGTANTAYGVSALFANTAGNSNTAIGVSALNSNTIGNDNTAIGWGALYANTTGSGNSAHGVTTLYLNTTGEDNSAFGKESLYSNTTGGSNSAFGKDALFLNTTGSSNTAIGKGTLFDNTTGGSNTAIGKDALYSNSIGFSNCASGVEVLRSNTTGFRNTAQGSQSLFNNTLGSYNTASGFQALDSNVSGSGNTALGSDALAFNSTGSNNTALGRDALASNTVGNNNTVLGYNADAGANNLLNATAIGAYAEVGASNSLVLGSIMGVNEAAASVNVGIGTTMPEVRLHVEGGLDATPTSGGYLVTGSLTGSNVVIDNNEIMARSNGATSSLLLNFDGGGVGIGRSPVTNTLEVDGNASKTTAGDWLANSDARLKKNIQPLSSQLMLQSLLALRGVTYEWNDDKTGSKRPEGIQYGFTAQNIQEVFPTLVEEDKLGYLQTAYGTYDAMTVEAIRALNEKIEKLETENAAQRTEIERMKNVKTQLDRITAALAGAGITVEK